MIPNNSPPGPTPAEKRALVDRVAETHRVALSIDEAVATQIAQRCSEVETGARNIDHIMSRTLLPLISRALLAEMTQGPLPAAMQLGLDEEGGYSLSFSREGE